VLPASSPEAASVARVTIFGRVCHGRPGLFCFSGAEKGALQAPNRQVIALSLSLGVLPHNPLMRYARCAGPGL